MKLTMASHIPVFQPTLPKGSDTRSMQDTPPWWNFNPHSPKGVTPAYDEILYFIPISTHTPQRE